jgi:hypothetical protein
MEDIFPKLKAVNVKIVFTLQHVEVPEGELRCSPTLSSTSALDGVWVVNAFWRGNFKFYPVGRNSPLKMYSLQVSFFSNSLSTTNIADILYNSTTRQKDVTTFPIFLPAIR